MGYRDYMDQTFLSRLIAKEDGDKDDAEKLFKHLTKHNYKPHVVEWVKGARVHKANVPVSRIEYNGKPEDPEKMARMVRQLKSGEQLPRVLLADTGTGKYRIADGHHRAFASREAGLTTVRCYVITHVTDDPKEPWRIMHDQQRAAKPKATKTEKAQAVAPEPDSNAKRSQMTPLGDPPFTQGDPNAPGERYPTANVTLQPSGKQLRVRVADTPALRKVGLQNTPDMGTDFDGMLFKWPGDAQATMHNHKVNFPVSCTWFDSSGMYVDHAHMLPGDATPKQARGKHRYALEVHSRDWDSLGLGPGAAISEASEKDQSRNGTIQMGESRKNSVIE